jgi:DNA mismatch repair protein MutL
VRQEIRPLATETVNRIAAGEVVESPASVLKELLENALDAGATRIELDLAAGGIGMIKIADNGCGIPGDQLPEAMERHSTSKIRELADIESAGTLGFRGEALAAIASVSLIEIVTRIEEEPAAWSITSRGGELTDPKPRAREQGTTITVRELFGDIPARRKFLRSESAEKRRLLGVWHRVILAWPELNFILRENGREIANYPSVENLRVRARQILGENTARHMVEVAGEIDGYRLSGLATLPLVSRGNRSQQYLYLGRRPFSDQQIGHAIGQAYSEVLVPGRFPSTILFLETPPGMVDVNVHPAKLEVRFRDSRLIHHLVSRSLRKAIGGQGDLGKVLAESEDLLVGAQRVKGKGSGTLFQVVAKESPRDQELPGLGLGSGAGSGGSGRSDSGGASQGNSWQGERTNFTDLGAAMGGKGDPQPQEEEGDKPEDSLFWQLHRTFILTQIRGGLVIVDQHNAHERVLFDRARAALAGEPAGSQRLLFPHTVELGPDEMEAWREQEDFLGSLGFLIEEFGPQTLSIVGIPDTLRRWDGGQVIRDILDDVVAETGGPTQKRDRALASYSCRSAIKAGEPLREEEMRHLVDQLFATADPYTCPHGRPIVIRISMDELEKRFHRTVPDGAK